MSNNKPLKILITGGHATPAFAVVDEIMSRGLSTPPTRPLDSSPPLQLKRGLGLPALPWREQAGGVQFAWVGHKHAQRGSSAVSGEYKTVTEKYSFKFYNLKSGKLIRYGGILGYLRNIFEPFWFLYGLTQSFRIILLERPDVIISFGGYLAVPIVILGKIFGAKVLTHEQTIVTGLANKVSAKFSNVICLSFEASKKFYKGKNVVFTGNPIRKAIFESKTNSLTANFDKGLPTIYITPGNQGSHVVNEAIFAILPELLKVSNVIHQTGNSTITNDNAKAQKLRETLPQNLKAHYTVRDYVMADEIGEALQSANVVVARGGANTILEILALGKLAVMIPIPWSSHNEQLQNAKLVETVGLGKIIEQKNLTPDSLFLAIQTALENLDRDTGFDGKPIIEVATRAKSQVKLDAASKVVNEIEKLL